MRHVRRVLDRVGLVQIDSVNVVVRSHELPLFSRLGPYPRGTLDLLAGKGELFEYWGHEASFIPTADFPLYRFKMDRAHWVLGWSAQVLRDRPGYLEAVLEEVRERGPLTASELHDPGERAGPWWGWNHGKRALELLFARGEVSARRRPSFEREYDLTERMIPAEVRACEVTADEARRQLLVRAARSLGVATAGDLADYHRLHLPTCRPLVQQLVDEGVLVPVEVVGWDQPAYLDPAARRPRRVDARALLTPFDSLVWERSRTERLFGFRYRIEIYTPAPKRVYGYYVLPFLLGEELVARVDLKADRRAGVLLVPGAYAEPGRDKAQVAAALADELHLLAGWLGLGDVVVGERGGLAGPLSRALRSTGPAPVTSGSAPTA